MKRSLQEVVELVVFGLIALLIGTGLLWLVGWVMGLVGLLFKFVAGLIWWLLRFIVPVAIVAGLIYFLVRVLQGERPAPAVTPASSTAGTGASGTTYAPPSEGSGASASLPQEPPAAGATAEASPGTETSQAPASEDGDASAGDRQELSPGSTDEADAANQGEDEHKHN